MFEFGIVLQTLELIRLFFVSEAIPSAEQLKFDARLCDFLCVILGVPCTQIILFRSSNDSEDVHGLSETSIG